MELFTIWKNLLTVKVLHLSIRLGLTITQLNHKVNDDDTNIRGKEYKSEKAKVLIARASGLSGVPTLGPMCHVTFPIWKSHDPSLARVT